MAEYIYPAVFHANEDGSYTITYPDLPGCISEGKTLGNALAMAQSALNQWVSYSTDKGLPLSPASDEKSISLEAGEFVNLVCADVRDNKAVRRTVSLPKWMDEKVTASGISLSRVLQDALQARLN